LFSSSHPEELRPSIYDSFPPPPSQCTFIIAANRSRPILPVLVASRRCRIIRVPFLTEGVNLPGRMCKFRPRGRTRGCRGVSIRKDSPDLRRPSVTDILNFLPPAAASLRALPSSGLSTSVCQTAVPFACLPVIQTIPLKFIYIPMCPPRVTPPPRGPSHVDQVTAYHSPHG